MAVYYKFKSAKDYDSMPIEGQFISVANLKERIFESKHLGRRNDFDLMVSNAQNNEEYVDEGAMIPRSTSVLIRRVPGRPRNPIVTERAETKPVDHKIEDIPPCSSILASDSSAMKYHDEYDWDEFGNDMYSIPEVHPVQYAAPIADGFPPNRFDEESKIKALVDTPALDWNRQGHDSYGSGRGFGRGMPGRMNAGHCFGRGGFEKKTPPAGYICHRCKIPGHFIQHCPTNGDPNYDIKRVKPPTGIPRSMLMATPDGSYALPSGAVAVLKPNEAAFDKEVEGLPSTRAITDIPPEFRCPLCKEIMKDAVLTSKCCFQSFCDKCIRDYILANLKCVCGATNMLADDLLPNKTLRDTISRILETTTSSTENAGSFAHVQDMESARHVQPRVPSPTLSVASKDEHKQPSPVVHNEDNREIYGTSESKADNVARTIIDKKFDKSMNPFELTPDSTNAKEQVYTEAAPISEEAQDKFLPVDLGKKKKKKKARISTSGADMQWKNFQDYGVENYAVMPMGPSPYDPYWANGMPIGMDGYIPPMACPMPFMGYTPGPFDVPFGGMQPHDSYAVQGYMMPGFPQRDLAELGMNGFGMSHRPPIMSREEFDARKGDMKRKREIDRGEINVEREREKGPGKEANSNFDAPYLPKAKPRLKSEAANVDSLDRDRDMDEKQEMVTDIIRPVASSQHSPPGSVKRKAYDRDSGEALSMAERKQKGSVFSRISFPSDINEGDRKRSKRNLSSSDPPKDCHDRERNRPILNGHHTSSSSRGGEGFDYESSDEERHFKRRLSNRRESERAEDSGRLSRVSRERDRR